MASKNELDQENELLREENRRLTDQVSELQNHIADTTTNYERRLSDQRRQLAVDLHLARVQFGAELAQTRQETTRALGRGDGAMEMARILFSSVVNSGNSNDISVENLMAEVMAEIMTEKGFPIGS